MGNLRTALRQVVVTITGVGLAAVTVWAQEPGKDDFVPAKPGDLGEHLPATPFVFWAYAVVWLVLVAYVLSLWRRITAAEREIATVTAKLESKG